MEFKQQTEVLSPDKEKQLVEKISALRAEFKAKKEQMEKTRFSEISWTRPRAEGPGFRIPRSSNQVR
jgi:uncharacterized coiled-coil DUF342 family protein